MDERMAARTDHALPPLTADERVGMRDMWAVYERHYEEIAARLLHQLSSDPAIGPLIRATPDEEREEQGRISRELMSRAILEDDWAPYLQNLREQGRAYADLGLPLEAWFRIVASFRPLLRPHLLDEYGSDMERFLRALEGMARLIDILLAEIGEAYLWRKERTISRQEEAIREMSISQTVLTNVPDGVVTTDPEGLVWTINPAMERFAGWSIDEVAGRPYHEVFPVLDGDGEPIPPDDRFLSRAIRSGQIVTGKGYEVTMLTRDGRHVPVAITAAPIVDEHEKILGGVDVIRDVSHEREVDMMKSTLISTVSHELRTPLTMISGFAELLVTRSLEAEQARHAAGQIHESAQRLERLIDDLLSVARIESGRIQVHRERLDLAGLIEEVAGRLAPGERLQLGVDGVGEVLGDRDMVARALTNLISNAIKYSADDRPITITAIRKDEVASIAVTDSGIGMAPEEQAQLFERFFRSDRAEVREVRGTGLGLYITRNLVELQGGRIQVDSTLGKGSTFTFTLPLADKEEGP